jgi:hypothetical protein
MEIGFWSDLPLSSICPCAWTIFRAAEESTDIPFLLSAPLTSRRTSYLGRNRPSMLECASPLTPTITTTFDHQSILSHSSGYRFNSVPPITTCRPKDPRSQVAKEEGIVSSRKRRRLVDPSKPITMQKRELSEREEYSDTVMSPLSSHTKYPVPQQTGKASVPPIFSRNQHLSFTNPATPAPALNQDALAGTFASQQSQESSPSLTPRMETRALPERNVAGPSRLGLPLRQGLTSSVAPSSQPSRLSSRLHRKPVKLTLSTITHKKIAPSDLGSLHVNEMPGQGSRSVPSSPMLHASLTTSGDDEEEAEVSREQLRANLRGSLRKRPSVPFALQV